jgi:hypothetical protein
MTPFLVGQATLRRLLFALGVVLLVLPGRAAAQDIADVNPADTAAKMTAVDTAAMQRPMANTTAGEFTPAKGFQLFMSPNASLNISVYGLFRWIDQTPGDQTYTDHLDREREVAARNDMYWQRTMVWFTGFFWRPQLRYNITLWSLGATQQTLVFGNLQYQVGRALTVGVGMAPNLTVRSMQGSWPFWAGSDRQMTEEFMRGGFSSGVFVTGQPLSRFWYTAGVNTNLSQLGVTASNDGRGMSYSGSVQWMPTTGEFGPRGGFGDLEHHDKLATRFGASYAYAPDEYRAAPLTQDNPNETQLKFSDGVLAFERGALADGVAIEYLAYNEFAIDAGLKYRGWSFQTEYYERKLSDFVADGPLPLSSVTDRGLQAQLGYMVLPRHLMLYATGGYIWDQFERHPNEFSPGVSWYPTGTRSWRVNLHTIHVEKTPAGSTFGYYASGQSGWTYSLGTDFLF